MKVFVRMAPESLTTPPMGIEARQEAGYLIRSLQAGLTLTMPKARRMSAIGSGCFELRIRDREANQTWRIVCYVDKQAVVVLDWFSKKTNKTPRLVIERCKARLRQYKSF